MHLERPVNVRKVICLRRRLRCKGHVTQMVAITCQGKVEKNCEIER